MMIAQMHCHALDKKGRFLGEIAPSMSRHDKMSLTKRLLQLSADKIPFDKKMDPYKPHGQAGSQGQEDQARQNFWGFGWLWVLNIQGLVEKLSRPRHMH